MFLNTIKCLFPFTKPFIPHFILTGAASVTATLLSLSIPMLIGSSVDLAAGEGNVDFKGILSRLFMIAAFTIISAVLQYFASYYSGALSFWTVNKMRIELFNKLNLSSLKYIDSTPHGDIVGRMINDPDAVSEGMFQFISQIFSGIITILGTLCFMLATDFSMSIIVIVTTPIAIVVAFLISYTSSGFFKSHAKIQGDLTGLSEEMISGQKVVAAFGHEKQSIMKFKEINNDLYYKGVKSQFFSSLANPSARFVSGLVYAAVGTFGAYICAAGGNITIGMISSMLIYVNQYTRPFNEITGIITQLQSAIAALQRVEEVFRGPVPEEDDEDDIILNNCEGNIDIKNLYFSYNKSTPLIENFSLSVKKGQKTAIVGPTGCGKSTLINLLMRFYEPDKGVILLDKTPINHINKKSLRSMYGMILQDTWLYNASVKDNISYGKPHSSIDEIINAAKLAHAHSFIKRLDKGYDTIISEDGTNISQGQKQLLCIARVMLTNPSILILDEATSSVDIRTELKIQKAFNRLMRGKTSFIVAHRLSTVENADMIIVMNDGKIIENGTHTELLLKNGFYSSLYNTQFSL